MTQSACDGTEARFERLFAAYQQPILNYLYRLVGDLGRAEDLAQDTFVKAYRSLARLPMDANERAWLYRIASNTAHDWHRRRRLIQWLPLIARDGAESPGRDHAGAVVESQAVLEALRGLPTKYREPLILYNIQGLSTSEIAEVMGLSRSAVKVRLFRARELFRATYGEGEAKG